MSELPGMIPASVATTDAHGLTEREARKRLEEFGPNTLESKKRGPLQKFLAWVVSPISLMLLAAAALSFIAGRPADGWITLVLFMLNFGIRLWHEGKADQAVEKLAEHLSIGARVLRDGTWQEKPAADLVPGDVVMLTVGMIVPADARVFKSTNLSLNESMLTGESLPREHAPGDTLYSGAFVTTGNALATITTTGNRTYFGKTLAAVSGTKKRSVLEQDILTISRFLSAVAGLAIVILSVSLATAHATWIEIATLDLSLLIAGIPVALPTVMSLIMSVGVLQLAKKNAIVRRLASLEDLANVNLLLTDKTGTLTENRIRVDRVLPITAVSEKELLLYAVSATDPAEHNPLEDAIIADAKHAGAERLPQEAFIPGDSERKRSTATLSKDGSSWTVSLGSPDILRSLIAFPTPESQTRYDTAVEEAAKRGNRTLAVAGHAGTDEHELSPLGLVFLSDTLRADAAATVAYMESAGIEVKMLTGDGQLIASQVARDVNLQRDILPRSVFDSPEELHRAFADAGGFSGVLPKDKLAAIEEAKRSHVVAMTGDGVNDVPPVKAADVGIAVRDAVDALKSTADIVLTGDGIGVIRDAIIEARKVFARVYNYSIYRLSESFRLIVTIALIGVVMGTYPLTPIQIILLALLNDVPIVSLAFDHVHAPRKPATINVKRRFILSSLYGVTGIFNSVLMLALAVLVLHLPWGQVQTLFFLKLVVSGHLLVYIAHTKERWFRYLPSLPVIGAVSATQLLATAWAFFGILTPALPIWLIAFVWVWSFFWMQTAELGKMLVGRLSRAPAHPPAISQ